jgi:small conductance mechanosensitive channel
MNPQTIVQTAIPLLTYFAWKVAGAIVLWLVARRLIAFAVRLLVKSLKYPFDQTVAGYIGTAVSVVLNIVLIVAILGFFGIETTSFAALMAGVGIAIGAAWSGLLGNLAAGVFILILRPFKVGDFISAGGTLGTVNEIALFVTTITTPDNIRTFVATARSSPTISRTSRPTRTGAWIWSPSSTIASATRRPSGCSRSGWAGSPMCSPRPRPMSRS